jgi:branched-chain amino acid aminotransferase
MAARITESEWIWRDGEFVRWEDATVHVLSTAVQFGTSLFEGIRAYETPRGPAIFRLREHIRRLFDSSKIYRMVPPQSPDEVFEACVEVVRRNGLGSCYIRPMVVRGYGIAGLHAADGPLHTYVSAWSWGTYLGAEALEQGVNACTSSWSRAAPNTFPTLAKSAGHYNSSQLMKAEAVVNGYDEAIGLGPSGLVSEGSGQNIFGVRDGVLFTPVLDGTSLAGITRDAVLQMAEEHGIEVQERLVAREALYTADELFFCGTASEITPIRSVDRILVGNGTPGPVTRELQHAFFALVRGEAEDTYGWLTHVEP